MGDVIRETINLPRGKHIRVVGLAGGDSLNFDMYDTTGDVVCSEPDREQARRLRDALDRFLAAGEGVSSE